MKDADTRLPPVRITDADLCAMLLQVYRRLRAAGYPAAMEPLSDILARDLKAGRMVPR